MQLLLGALVKKSTCKLQLCLGAPFWHRVAYLHIAVTLGSHLKGRVLNLMWFGKYYTRGWYIFHQKGGIFTRKIPWWGPLKSGVPRQVSRLPSLKHTTVYNPDNDLIWECETDWTRSASADMRSFSPDVRMWTLYCKVSMLLNLLKLLMKLSLQKTQI